MADLLCIFAHGFFTMIYDNLIIRGQRASPDRPLESADHAAPSSFISLKCLWKTPLGATSHQYSVLNFHSGIGSGALPDAILQASLLISSLALHPSPPPCSVLRLTSAILHYRPFLAPLMVSGTLTAAHAGTARRTAADSDIVSLSACLFDITLHQRLIGVP